MKRNNPKASVFNRQRGLSVDTESLRAFVDALTVHLELRDGFTVVLVSDPAMRRYNREFRGKDYPTDVLSFPLDENERAQESYMGDILISVPAADRQKSGTLLLELEILTLHGVLHLLGFDHETDDGEMERYESRLRKELRLGQ